MDRKKLRQEYELRTHPSGVYTITNTANGRYFLCQAEDINAARNRFEFSKSTGACVIPSMESDWKALGSDGFVFVVREEIKPKPDQTMTAFKDDLRALEKKWRGILGETNTY